MTRSYALRKLLEHGPMTRREIVQCTRWSDADVEAALKICSYRREVRWIPRRGTCGQRLPHAYRAV